MMISCSTSVQFNIIDDGKCLSKAHQALRQVDFDICLHLIN